MNSNDVSNWRYERKYWLNADCSFTNLKYLWPELSTPYPSRQINNVYFDTLNYQCYSDSLNGVFNRYKVRMRWYGIENSVINDPQLEIKYKNGLLGRKKIFYSNSVINKFKTDNLPALFSDEAQIFFQTMMPTLYNSYIRQYFLISGTQFRVTVDTKIKNTFLTSYNEISRLFNNNFDNISSEPLTVIELKYPNDSFHEILAADFAQKINATISNFSKYTYGLFLSSG